MKIAKIKLSQIDSKDQTFSLLPPIIQLSENKTLERSISRTGILHPPILKEKAVGMYQIITGRQRIQVLKQKENLFTDCLILPMETPFHNALAIALEETLLSRKPSPVEQAVFFTKILTELSEEEAIKRFLPLLKLQAHPLILQRILIILELEDHLIIALHNGRLNEIVARQLAELDFPDRIAIFEIIDNLNLSTSNQKKFLAACLELAARNLLPIKDLVSSPEVLDILECPNSNPPQKATKLMHWLNRAYFPRLTEAEDEFRSFISTLNLPDFITIAHSQSFEKDELTMKITLKNKNELSEKWPNIARALNISTPHISANRSSEP
jgi:hypothetical protein